MLAFHNDSKLRKQVIGQMKAHIKADELIKGIGWENGKGCFIGCSIHEYDHAKFVEKLGFGHEALAALLDTIFEHQKNGDAKKFAASVFPAVKVGADLSRVHAKFLVWCLLDKKYGAVRAAPADKFKDCHNAVLQSAAVWQNFIKTGVIDKEAARDAAWAARDAARAAGDAARAAWAAGDAAWAAWAAGDAARAAGAAGAAGAAWDEFWKAAASTMIKLLKKAK